MGGQYSEDREDEQRLSGETVSVLPDKTDEKVNVLPDDEWDYYSGLPSPKWYKKQKKMSDITYEDLSYRLRSEGEGYALKHYYGPDIEHEDEEVVRLWKEAHDKLIELENYINKKCEEEIYGNNELD